jgi:hypothetical protein
MEYNIKIHLMECIVRIWTGLFRPGICPVGGLCLHDNERSWSVKLTYSLTRWAGINLSRRNLCHLFTAWIIYLTTKSYSEMTAKLLRFTVHTNMQMSVHKGGSFICSDCISFTQALSRACVYIGSMRRRSRVGYLSLSNYCSLYSKTPYKKKHKSELDEHEVFNIIYNRGGKKHGQQMNSVLC